MLLALRRGEIRARKIGGQRVSGSDLTAGSLVQGVRGWFLRVENKGRVREIPLEGRAFAILQEMVTEAKTAGREALVPVSYDRLWNWFSSDVARVRNALEEDDRHKEAEAWDGLTFHSLRGTGITLMINGLKMPLGDVAAAVGHSDIRVTEGYREPDELMVRRSLAGLSELIIPSGSVRSLPEASGTTTVRHARGNR